MSNSERIREIIAGNVDAVCLEASVAEPYPAGETHHSGLIFPGSFNPLHDGHLQMANVAASRLDRRVEFELSIENVDKPTLEVDEISARAQQFADHQPLWLTKAARFTEKAAIFPGATFIVGIDTLARLGDVAYYEHHAPSHQQAIAALMEYKVRFLVFGRRVGENFRELSHLALPAELADLCDAVPADEFRHDISSTQLRRPT